MAIIKKAADAKKVTTTLIFGKVGDGRSHLAFRTAKAQGWKKVLVLTVGAPSLDIPDDWDSADIGTWEDVVELRLTVSDLAASGKGYDCIILDKFDLAMPLIPTKNETASKQEWGVNTGKWIEQLTGFFDSCKSVIVTVSIEDKEEVKQEGERQVSRTVRRFALNAAAKSGLISRVTNRWYVFTAELENDEGEDEKVFCVQPNWLYGQDFEPNACLILDYRNEDGVAEADSIFVKLPKDQ